MKFKLISNWNKKKLRCHYCGETKSVKYTREIYDPTIDANNTVTVNVCNKCAFVFGIINKEGEIINE